MNWIDNIVESNEEYMDKVSSYKWYMYECNGDSMPKVKVTFYTTEEEAKDAMITRFKEQLDKMKVCSIYAIENYYENLKFSRRIAYETFGTRKNWVFSIDMIR